MTYIDKLRQFNGTEKYIKELHFLKALIGSESKLVMDYGCGINTALKFLNSYTSSVFLGYDKTKFVPTFEYCSPFEKVNVVYFMHSIAHIEDIESVLKSLNTSIVIVITPNKDWLKLNKNDHYKPDKTVIKHFNQESLIDLFESCGYEIDISGSFGDHVSSQNERLFLKAKKLK